MTRGLAGLPEAEAFVSDAAMSRAVSRAVGAGAVRKLASRLYTRNLSDPPEAVVRRNRWRIAAGYFPGALVADRTALEGAPAPDGSVFLVSAAGRDVALPGCVLRPRRGAGPLPADRPFMDGLFLSSPARAWLENMRPSRSRGGRAARTFPRRIIEERLDDLVRRSGEAAANRLRDEVRAVAPALELEEEARALDALIGALLGTRSARLTAPSAIARQRGRPYDPRRLELFESLRAALHDRPPSVRLAQERNPAGRDALAFFEAYFSNFIEGTEFAVEEAADIVFRGAIPAERPEDAHDVLGTWRIVSDDREMRRRPTDPATLERILKDRHAAIMARRPEARPGAFKFRANRAGATEFVAPDLVAGTLERGFAAGRALDAPFQRAAFVMFLVAEVHPFADGNGRVARAMMNAELVAAGEERIVVPSVFRADYLAALKALSRAGRAEPLIRVLDYAQRWTAAVDWRSVERTRRVLEECGAFLDPAVAEAEGRRLRMPERAAG